MAVESPKIWKWMFDTDADEDVALAPPASKFMPSPSSSPSSSSSKRMRTGSPTGPQIAYLPSPPPGPTIPPVLIPKALVTKRASNPLPALVIGVTGIAMSAHHQTYLFQVQIHALWGYLLLGFAICRCLTCFFEWVRPQPQSIQSIPPIQAIRQVQVIPANHYSHRAYSSDEKLKGQVRHAVMGTSTVPNPLPSAATASAARAATLPGRPPSELVGSVFLGAGGIVFICSDEQITFWAMRNRKGELNLCFVYIAGY